MVTTVTVSRAAAMLGYAPGGTPMRRKSLGHEAALRWAYLAGIVWFGVTSMIAFSVLSIAAH